LRAWQLSGFERHHFRALNGTAKPGHLAVGRREVVVPEERHLFLERPLRMQHSEEPPLTRVFDIRIRGELPAGRDTNVTNLADLRVDIVRQLLILDESIDNRSDRQVLELGHFGGSGAKPRSPKKVIQRILASCHRSLSREKPVSILVFRKALKTRHLCEISEGRGPRRSCRRLHRFAVAAG
jgi:hypothetical protein